MTKTVPRGRGLYVALDVESTPELNEYMASTAPAIGEPLNADNLHVSILYASELVAAGIQLDDADRFSQLEAETIRRIAALDVAGYHITPCELKMRKFSRYAALPIEPTDELRAVRKVGLDVLEEEFGVRLIQGVNDYHLSLIFRPGAARLLRRHEVPINRALFCRGHRVAAANVYSVPRVFQRRYGTMGAQVTSFALNNY